MATLEEALSQAAASRDAGRLDIAENVYRAILAKFPQNTEAQSGLNDLLAAQGRSGGTLQQTEIESLIALYDSGNLGEAATRAEALIEKFPAALVLHNVLGAVQMDQDKLVEAVETFRTALALEPNGAAGHNNLGIALNRTGARDDARASFEQAITLQPDFADAHKNLGALQLELGNVEDAIASLRTGDPDTADPDCSALLLEAYLRQGNRTAFDIQLQLIKLRQDAINIRAAATAAYAAQQFGSKNIYAFCADPFAKMSCLPLPPGVGASDLAELAVLGTDDTPSNAFDGSLRETVDRYRSGLQDENSLYCWGWPQDYEITARRVRQPDEDALHTRRSWMNGFAFLGDDGAPTIDFSLRGYNLPVLCDDTPVESVTLEPGTCVLFPASLPHRVATIPAEGLLFSIDLLPK